ncbi:MAG: ABC transporter permease [Phycisphaerales bacterium]|nr:ABC transporter permease [Phycisphaerales bacterium]
MNRAAQNIRAVVAPVVAVLVILAGWQAAVIATGVSPFLLPRPTVIAETMWQSRALLFDATLRTATAALAGFAIASAVGVIAGSLIAALPILRRSLYPLATILQMVPLVAVAPLLVIWFGFGLPTAIAASAVVAVFPVLASTIDGLRSVDPGLREIFALAHASPWTRWRKLDLPASVPAIVTGLRIAAGLAVIGAIVGEFVSGYGGSHAPLGIVVMTAMREARTDLVFGAVALCASVGFFLFGVVSTLGWLLARRWHPSAQDEMEIRK